MTTRERATLLAAAARSFAHLLGEMNALDLLGVVRWELGHEEMLDGFQRYAGQMARAVAPERILHVMSRNTPHAGLQSLLRGLLLGSHNFCKIPGTGLPEIEQFRAALPPELRCRVEISRRLAANWLHSADAVIVFGNDETIAQCRRRVRPEQRFIPHGHMVSLSIVFEDPDYTSVAPAARDVSLFDQQGCLSPHCIYVSEAPCEYAARLAHEMDQFNAASPRAEITPRESAAIQELRDTIRFREASGEAVGVWASQRSTAWTVVFEADPAFMPSCLNRVIFVKPLPADLKAVLRDIRPHLSTVAIWPSSSENAARASSLGASRVCAVGRMQTPPFAWHQDGGQNLAPLVRWIDWEPGHGVASPWGEST